MEKTLKLFLLSAWPVVQVLTLLTMGLFMVWVFQRSGWDLATGIGLLTTAMFCWSIYRVVLSLAAGTDRERLDANWILLALAHRP